MSPGKTLLGSRSRRREQGVGGARCPGAQGQGPDAGRKVSIQTFGLNALSAKMLSTYLNISQTLR